MEARRSLLRLSLALNVVLVVTAWFGVWSLTSGGDSHLSRLCELATNPATPGTGDLKHLFDSHAAQPAPSCGVCDAGERGRALCDEWG